MATTYLAPGVYFEQADTAAPAVAPLRTDIAAFVGIAERGPLHTPVRVESWEQFQSSFGGLIREAFLAYSVRAFFENGGRTCWVVRVAAGEALTRGHAADGSTLAVTSAGGFVPGALVAVTQERSFAIDSAHAQPSDRRSSVVSDISALARGAVVRFAQAGAPVTHRAVAGVDPARRAVTWDRPLDPAYDLTHPVDLTTVVSDRELAASVTLGPAEVALAEPLGRGFAVGPASPPVQVATGAAPARADVLAEQGATPALRISARSPGRWGDQLAVRVARSHPAATRTLPAAPGDAPHLARVASIAGFERGALVHATQDGRTAYVVVARADAAVAALTFTGALPAAFDRSRAITLETVELSVAVELGGSLRELHTGLVPIAGNPANVATAVTERSALIAVEDPSPVPIDDPSPPYPARLPDLAAANLVDGRVPLAGGRDGLAGIRPRDFRGDALAPEKHGLRALEDVDEVALVAVPDILVQPPEPAPQPAPPPAPDPCALDAPEPSPPEPPPAPEESAPRFTADDVAALQQALVAHCEARADRFALIDPPPTRANDDPAGLDAILAWRRRFDTSYAALYYPWVRVYDPLATAPGGMRALPPSGHVAGAIARTDLATGVHAAPANAELEWAQAFTAEIGEPLQEVLNPLQVNCLRTLPGRGLRVYGARTLSSDSQWRFVNVRRLLTMIEKAVLHATQWAVFEPNGAYLRAQVTSSITAFLTILWRGGALAGATTDEAFFVRAGEDENPPDAVANGEMLAVVGVAAVRPAEFVVFRIGRSEGALEVIE